MSIDIALLPDMHLSSLLEIIRTYSPPPPWMGPWFAGDVIGETYLDPSYTDAKGNMVIDVTDFFSSLNKTNPGP